MINTNPETGIRYTLYAANDLDSEIVENLQMRGACIELQSRQESMETDLRRLLNDYGIDAWRAESIVADAFEGLTESFEIDEPTHEGIYQDVHYRTTWLGGALHVFILQSPWIEKFKLCSPCVPNACDGGASDYNGEEGYAVPLSWIAPVLTESEGGEA